MVVVAVNALFSKIYFSIGDWWSHCLTEHAVLSSFDVRIPDNILPDTPDDRRLTGAIASDGTVEIELFFLNKVLTA